MDRLPSHTVQLAVVRLEAAGVGGAAGPDAVVWSDTTLAEDFVGGAASVEATRLHQENVDASRGWLLSPQEDAACARLRHEEDRRTYRAVHGLLRAALARRLHTDPMRLLFRKGVFGKPSLDDPAGIHFSLSYRRGWAAAAIADAEVGVDLEVMGDLEGLPDVARRSFTDAELAHLAGLTHDAWTREFFTLWTRKEALIKAAGLGVDYMPQTPALKSQASLIDEAGVPRRYRVQHFAVAGGVSLALALAEPGG